MFQKLTANLKKSESYGKKIIEELSTIGNQILKNKIEISNLEKRVEQTIREEEIVTTKLKRQSQQCSSYEYKVQKLEIRLKQYQRKLQIQQQIHDKKNSHRENMLRKIESIQNQIKSENQSNEEENILKKQIEQANTRINRQSIEIQNLFHELMNKNKHLRIKEDQLQAKRKVNKKKKDRLMQLESKINNKDNKENQNMNSNIENPNEKIEKLSGKKQDADKILTQNIQILLGMCDKFDELAEANIGIKRQTNKDWEIFQEIKSQRNILTKLKNNKVVHQ